MNAIGWFVVASAGLFVAALAAWAVVMVLRVNRLKASREEARNNRHRQLCDGLDVLAGSLLQGQINLTEACIRIRYHLEQLAGGAGTDPEFGIFDTVAEKTAHIPTHDQYRQLAPAEQWRLDQDRVAVEDEHRDAVLEACRSLKTRLEAGTL